MQNERKRQRQRQCQHQRWLRRPLCPTRMLRLEINPDRHIGTVLSFLAAGLYFLCNCECILYALRGGLHATSAMSAHRERLFLRELSEYCRGLKEEKPKKKERDKSERQNGTTKIVSVVGGTRAETTTTAA